MSPTLRRAYILTLAAAGISVGIVNTAAAESQTRFRRTDTFAFTLPAGSQSSVVVGTVQAAEGELTVRLSFSGSFTILGCVGTTVFCRVFGGRPATATYTIPADLPAGPIQVKVYFNTTVQQPAGDATGTVSLTYNSSTTTRFGQGVFLDSDSAADVFRYHPGTGGRSNEIERERSLTSTVSAWSPGWNVQAADFDNDGYTDFFLYNPTSGQWFKALNNRANDYTYVSGAFSSGWRSYLGDLDGNGRPDLFLYNETNGLWAHCLSTGTGREGFDCVVRSWSAGWQLTPIDLNGDGKMDFFLYNPITGQWFRATNNGLADFTYSTGAWSAGWTIHVGSFNGDSLKDLFIYNSATGQWFIVTNTGTDWTYQTGTFSPAWTVRIGNFDSSTALDDLFLYNAATGQWVVAVNTGGGGFTTFAVSVTTTGCTPYLTDFNADQRADVLLYNVTTGAYLQGLYAGLGMIDFVGGSWGAGFTVLANTRNADY